MCSVLTSMATKENLVATEQENTSDSTSERNSRVDESEEVSVGSPEEPRDDELEPESPPVTNGSTTSALRVFRGNRKRRSSADSTEEDRPLDFSSAKDELTENSSANPAVPSYFLPYKKLEMTAESHMHAAAKLIKPVAASASSTSASVQEAKKQRRGVAGFSIDDILSHKTAALKEKQAESQQQQQPIVRPWDIHVGTASGGNGGTPPSAAATAMAAALHRKQVKNADDSGDSPLDALFQMASKTFEGLKAKTGQF